MMGNVIEWSDDPYQNAFHNWLCRARSSAYDWSPDSDSIDVYFKSTYHDDYFTSRTEDMRIGFRVASVPEPASLVLLVTAGLGALAYVWRRRS